MWCIWGHLFPVCALAFLSAQCELSKRKSAWQAHYFHLIKPTLCPFCLFPSQWFTQLESASPSHSSVDSFLLLTISPPVALNYPHNMHTHKWTHIIHCSIWWVFGDFSYAGWIPRKRQKQDSVTEARVSSMQLFLYPPSFYALSYSRLEIWFPEGLLFPGFLANLLSKYILI